MHDLFSKYNVDNELILTWFQRVEQDKNLTERARKKSIQAVKFLQMLEGQSRGQNTGQFIGMYTLRSIPSY